MQRPIVLSLCLLSGLLMSHQAAAAVKLPAVLSDHAVLNRAEQVPIWGWAKPGEVVTVQFDQQTVKTTANPQGKWRINLNLKQSKVGPFELKVTGSNQLVVKDVVVGEVWLASGQSNMEFKVGHTIEAPAEFARPANPYLREFKVARNTSLDPLDDCVGTWQIASPSTLGEFSAIGYEFAKEISAHQRAPVGILHSSWGGMNIERWVGAKGFAYDPVLNLRATDVVNKTRQSIADVAAYDSALRTWQTQHAREDARTGKAADFAAPGASAADWTPVTLPGELGTQGLPDAGAIWLRRTVHFDSVVDSTQFNIGFPVGFVDVYWNGTKVGEVTPRSMPDGKFVSFFVDESLIKPGDNTLAIRLFQPGRGAAVLKPVPNALNIGYGAIPLSGPWLAKVEQALPPVTPAALATLPSAPKPLRPLAVPSGMFNAMVHPLAPYALRGMLWYQGEANESRAVQYEAALTSLITGWRDTWGQPEVPFLIAQLANNGKKINAPGDSRWAELRASQTKALALPHTGMAVLTDVGEADDIHPRSKRIAAQRLALVARAKAYGDAIVYSGPVLAKATVEGPAMRLHFDHVGGGLVAKPLPATYQPRSKLPDTLPLVLNSPNSALQGFAVCGEDRQWFWADARIDGDTIVVQSAAVPKPVAVRYAWADNPTANLYNAQGLPAVPFRTDGFALLTEKAVY